MSGFRGSDRGDVLTRGGLIEAHAGALDLDDGSPTAGRGHLPSGRIVKAVGWRLMTIIATLIGVSIVAFILLELVPGDPAQVAAGEFASPEDVARVRANMNLDDPIVVRWARFVGRAVHGDLGTSVQVRPGASVGQVIWAAVPITAALTLVSLALAALISFPLGFIAALRPRSIFDRVVSIGASVALSVPPHVLGLLLLTALAINRDLLPPLGFVPFGEDPVEWLRHLAIPALTLAAVPIAEMTRQMRGALIDTFDQDFIRAARARGLRRSQIVGKHALKASAPPVVTVAGLQFARTLGGSVVVERIFNLPGLGSLTLGAVVQRDLPVIIGIVVVSALAVLVINLVVDLLNGRLAPQAK